MILNRLLAAPKPRQAGTGEKTGRHSIVRSPVTPEGQSLGEMLDEGIDAVLYLFNRRYIDEDLAERMLHGMLTGYVVGIVEHSVNDSIANLVSTELAELEQKQQ